MFRSTKTGSRSVIFVLAPLSPIILLVNIRVYFSAVGIKINWVRVNLWKITTHVPPE